MVIMSTQTQIQYEESVEKQRKRIYMIGGISTIIVFLGIVFDIVIGSGMSTNLTTQPQTAVGWFAEFQDNLLLGLYKFDLLNVINQIILIPTYFALYTALSKENREYAALALIIFLVGTTIFVTNNVALPMLELSNKYSAAAESQKTLLAAAGEAMLSRGAHGSLGVFMGFLLPTIASAIMSFTMLNGNVFTKKTSYIGIVGSILMLIYTVLVTFAPGIKSVAAAVAMPGGLLIMAWMVMFTIRLFKLGHIK